MYIKIRYSNITLNLHTFDKSDKKRKDIYLFCDFNQKPVIDIFICRLRYISIFIEST